MDIVKDLKPFFDHFDERFDELKVEIGSLRNDVRTLQTSVDGLAKMVKDYRDEHIVLYRKVEVLEEWAKKVAEKTGIPLPF